MDFASSGNWDLLSAWRMTPANKVVHDIFDWMAMAPSNTTSTRAAATMSGPHTYFSIVTRMILEQVPSQPDEQLQVALAATGISILLILFLLVKNRQLRCRQRRWNDLLRIDKRRTLAKVEDLTLKLMAREEECVILKQKLLKQERAAMEEREKLDREAMQQLSDKDQDYRELQAKLRIEQELLKQERTALEVREKLDREAMQQLSDREYQILEQKLQAGQLKHSLAERDDQVKDLMGTNKRLTQQLEELKRKSKKDALRAETTIRTLTAESEERFSVLRQEGDLLRSSLAGLIKITEEQRKQDNDKDALKKKTRHSRDERTGTTARSPPQDEWCEESNLVKECLVATDPSNGSTEITMCKQQQQQQQQQQPAGCEQIESRMKKSFLECY